MSERERQTILNCFSEIQEELHHSIDRHSRSIITSTSKSCSTTASASMTASSQPAKPSTAMSSRASKS